jgi:hypothetical protein
MNRHYGAIFIAAAIFAGRLAAVSHTIRRSRALFSKLVWRRFSGFRRPRGVRKCNISWSRPPAGPRVGWPMTLMVDGSSILILEASVCKPLHR